jgi:multidrug efflux system membrane fusion protein
MRLFSIFAAILVGVAIYMFVLERDRLASFFGAPPQDMAETASVADAAPPPEAESVTPVGVVALRSTARQIDSAVILRGQTEADRQVDLRAETSGQIVSPPLRKGAFVDENEVLCQLDPGTRAATLAEAEARLAEARSRVPEAQARVPESQARVEEARARLTESEALLREAEINANAATRLSVGGFASDTRVAQTEARVEGARAGITSARAALRSAESGLETVAAGIESARAGVQGAQAAVASAEKEIERLVIRAPFAGLLESDTAELGSLLQPGGLCATVIQLDPVVLVGFIPETEVSRAKPGAHATARVASGEEVTGEVAFVSRSADPATRTFRVEIEVPNPDLTLRDGQTAEIEISAEGKAAHLLPQSALTLNDAGSLGVRVVAGDGTAQFIAVDLLRDTPTGVFVTGLPQEADVIVIGQEFVTDGVPVRPRFQEVGQ